MAFPTYIPAYSGFNGGYYSTQQMPQSVQMPQPGVAPQQIAAAVTSNSAQNGLNWIEGAEAAKAYIVAPNCTVVLFDTKEPVMYIKSADLSGMPSTRTFKIEEIGDMPVSGAVKASVPDNKEDIQRLEDRISVLEAQIKGMTKGKGKVKEVMENEPTV